MITSAKSTVVPNVGVLPMNAATSHESPQAERACLKTMKPTRHRAEQIVKKLHDAATTMAGGKTVEEVSKGVRINPATYHRWQEAYGRSSEGGDQVRHSGCRFRR